MDMYSRARRARALQQGEHAHDKGEEEVVKTMTANFGGSRGENDDGEQEVVKTMTEKRRW
eukprot:8480773-Pyramimonas_sp.AAC.1